MERRQHRQIVESERPYVPRYQREAGPTRLYVFLGTVVLGVLLIGSAVLGILSIVDVIRGHPGESWQHFIAWWESIRWWLLAGIGVVIALNIYKERSRTAEERAEAAVKRAIAKKIREDTKRLRDTRYHNEEHMPDGFIALPDELGNYGYVISRDLHVTSLLPGNAPAGNNGMNPKHLMDFLERQNNVVDVDSYEEPIKQIARPKILLSEQIERGLTMPSEVVSVFGYPIDTNEPFLAPLFLREGNFVNSLMVLGDQGQGKSAIGVYLAGLTVNHGGFLLIIDPDASEEQSLWGRLGPLKKFALCEVADTPEKAMRLLQIAEEEIEHPSAFPLALLADEFSMVMRHGKIGGKWGKVADLVASTVENYATRGRKRLRRAIVFGQISNASRTGGTELRDSCDYLIFNTSSKKAERVLGDASDEEIAELAPSLTPGMAIVSPAKRSESYIMQFTFPDERGLHMIAEARAESEKVVNARASQLDSDAATFDPLQMRRFYLVQNACGTPRNEPAEQVVDASQNVFRHLQDPDLAVLQEGFLSVPNVPRTAANEPVAETERVRNAFCPGPTDKLLDDLQARLLVTFYQDCNDVKKALARIKLGTGYYRHACWILDSQGLRKRRT